MIRLSWSKLDIVHEKVAVEMEGADKVAPTNAKLPV